jgi:hypothetical protein
VTPDVFATIAAEAGAESALWAAALRAPSAREETPLFSQLSAPEHALAVETIYEGYLLHYGRPRLFEPADLDTAVLLGDYLYAHGLVRLAEAGSVDAVADLAELISLCAQLRAEHLEGDGVAWAATAALLGMRDPRLEQGRAALRLGRDPAPLATAARDAIGERLDAALAAHAGLAAPGMAGTAPHARRQAE